MLYLMKMNLSRMKVSTATTEIDPLTVSMHSPLAVKMPTVRTHLSRSVAYMRQSISSALVQIMACSLFGAKPLSMPMLGYCQMDPSEQTSVKF